MKNAANLFYFLAYRNAFQSYLQLDAGLDDFSKKKEHDEVYDNVNCIRKQRINFDDKTATLEKTAVFDMIFIAGQGFALDDLQQRLDYARRHLSARGVIVFDYANPDHEQQIAQFGCAWQLVSRLRCDPSCFTCVVENVGHGCAVYRPNCRSIAYATVHLSQYDNVEYLAANRELLLNLIPWSTFLTLIRFF